MGQHIASSASAAQPWNNLADFCGNASVCTCSDQQLTQIGCDCDAEQNLPVRCEDCGNFCRSEKETRTGICNSCRADADRKEIFRGHDFCNCGAPCLTETERAFGLCGPCGDDLFDAHN